MFPVEILDHIFSLCRDVRCLEESSRAHPLLSRIAERHLYVDIVLPNDTHYDSNDTQLPLDVRQLSNLLSERPHVANYVHSLTIAINSDEDVTFRFLEAVPSILVLLPKLRTVEVNSPMHPVFGVYQDFPEGFFISLEKSLGLPSMKQAKFYGIDFPLSLLHPSRCGKSIDKLLFRSCVVSEPEPEAETSFSDFPPLENLSIDNRSLEALVHGVVNRCGQLSQFRFSPLDKEEGEPFVLMKPILVSCSNTLTILDVDVESLYNYGDDREFLTLPTLPHLQEFTFHGKSLYYRSRGSCFRVLPSLLGIMPNLKRLILHLHFEVRTLDNLLPYWSELDALLATSRCSVTESIFLIISTRLSAKISWSDEDIKPYLMEYPSIKRMMEQNVLAIQMEYDHCYCTVK